MAHCCCHDFLQVIPVLQPISPKCIGGHDVCAGLQIGPVYGYKHIPAGQVPRFRKLSRFQALGLEQASHSAVAEQAVYLHLF